MEVLLADGTSFVAGSAGQAEHNEFFRFYGPDIVGLFCQDCGALGVKSTITLRLQRRPAETGGISFSCDTFEQSSQAMANVAREGIASENFGIPSALIAQTIARRAEPFPDHSMLSPQGERQLPFHAIFPFSQVIAFHQALQDFLQTHRGEMERHAMRAVAVYGAISTNGLLYEPVFQWSDVPSAFHRRHTPDAILARSDVNEPNPAARKLAGELKGHVVDLMFSHGGVHLQIGKAYPYLEERQPAQVELLRTLKRQLDPKGLINPGALGLP
jgi:FAD/FMN-containing dehydrogenase